jgi:branched-chain amino acid transport system substrate-binding protein
MKKSRVLTVVLAVMLIVSMGLVFGGCKAESKTIKIGAIMPMTGPVSLYGTGTVNAIKIAVDEINKAGGINGKQIEFIYEDDEAKPEKSVLAYKKLTTQDKVDVIIGCLTSSCSLAVAPLAQADKIPMISTSSTNLKVTQVGDYIFRTCYLDPFQGTGCANYAFKDLGKKTAAIMYDNANDYSKGLADAFEAAFTAAGGTITNKEAYTKGDTDFSAQLTKIKGSTPELLFLPDYYSTVSLVAKQVRSLGMADVVMMGGDGWDEIVNNAGEEVVGCYYLNHFTAVFRLPEGVNASVEASFSMPEGFPFRMAYRLLGDQGAIEFNGAGGSLLLVTNGKAEQIPVEGSRTFTQGEGEELDGYFYEIEYFLDCIKSGRQPERSTPEMARDALLIARQVDEALL